MSFVDEYISLREERSRRQGLAKPRGGQSRAPLDRLIEQGQQDAPPAYEDLERIQAEEEGQRREENARRVADEAAARRQAYRNGPMAIGMPFFNATHDDDRRENIGESAQGIGSALDRTAQGFARYMSSGQIMEDAPQLAREAPGAIGEVREEVTQAARAAPGAVRSGIGRFIEDARATRPDLSALDAVAVEGGRTITTAIPNIVRTITAGPFEGEEALQSELDYRRALGDEEGAREAAGAANVETLFAGANLIGAADAPALLMRGAPRYGARAAQSAERPARAIGEVAEEAAPATPDSLPMDEASRMARARAQGFDVDTPLYHGTQRDVQGSMRPSWSGANGPGVYVAAKPDTAASYAGAVARDGMPVQVGERTVQMDFTRTPFGDAGGNIMPVMVRGKMATPEQYAAALREAQVRLRAPDQTGSEVRELAQKKLQAMGYTGLRDARTDYNVIFPDSDGQARNIRSRFAAFDPARSGESDLLASAAPIGATGVGIAAMSAGDAQAQQSQPLEEANARISELESDAAFIERASRDRSPASVMEVQQFLQGQGLYGQGFRPDGQWGPGTQAAVEQFLERNRSEMEQARARVEEVEQQEASRTTRAGPLHEAAREWGPLAATVGGVAIGLASRGGAVRKADARLAQRNARMDALLTEGPIRRGRSAADRAEPVRRAANINEFWRQGGAGDRVPFATTGSDRGFQRRRQADVADPSELFPSEASRFRTQDYGVIGGGLAESGLSGGAWYLAQQELDEAIAAAEQDPSEANLARVERARDMVAITTSIARVGIGVAAGRTIASVKQPYSTARPNIGAAEAERLLLDQSVAPRRAPPRGRSKR